MGGTELTVLVVDDDFRVANMHSGIVNALPGFTVSATANTLAAARSVVISGCRAREIRKRSCAAQSSSPDCRA